MLLCFWFGVVWEAGMLCLYTASRVVSTSPSTNKQITKLENKSDIHLTVDKLLLFLFPPLHSFVCL
jgi:hypothetical protein